MKAESWLKKHWKGILILVALAYLLNVTGVLNLGIVNPGFPGAQVACYGVNFKDFGTDWSGTNVIHVAGAGESTLVSHSGGLSWDRIYWGDVSPTSLTVVHDNGGSLIETTESQLETDVESPIPLADYNYQNSTPLNIASGFTWDQGEVLPYWNPTGIVSNTTTTLPNGTQVNSVTYSGVEQTLLLIPGNFFLTVNIPSSRYEGDVNTGWQTGSWDSTDFWYEVYWYNWLNAYSTLLEGNAGVPPSSVTAYNARAQQFNLEGGFPIQGWVQQYASPMNGIDISQIIVGNKDGSTTNLTATGVSLTTLANIEAQINLAPEFDGQPVILYTQPGDQYALPTASLPVGPIDANAQGLMHSPDVQTVLPAEYFKIHVNNLGTWTDGNWLTGYTVYYPAVSYIIRFIFAVYGTQTFVWTVSTAASLGYNATQNYQPPPAQYQPKQIVNAYQAGLGLGLANWFSNPLNWVPWVLLIVLVILLVFAGPSVSAILATILGRRKQSE
jgi:hypothetical protein